MSDKQAGSSTSVLESPLGASGQQAVSSTQRPGFLRRYRLPLFLAVLAVCLYAGSILYILYGRGQVL